MQIYTCGLESSNSKKIRFHQMLEENTIHLDLDVTNKLPDRTATRAIPEYMETHLIIPKSQQWSTFFFWSSEFQILHVLIFYSYAR